MESKRPEHTVRYDGAHLESELNELYDYWTGSFDFQPDADEADDIRDLLGDEITQVNGILFEKGVIGAPAIANGSVLVGVGEDHFSSLDATVYGAYDGMALMQDGDTNEIFIFNVIKVDHIEAGEDAECIDISSDNYEYVFVPLEEPGGIAFLNPPMTEMRETSDWHQDIHDGIEYALGSEINFKILEVIFKKIIRESKKPHEKQKNIDWFLDRVNGVFTSYGEELEVDCRRHNAQRTTAAETEAKHTILHKRVVVHGRSLGITNAPNRTVASKEGANTKSVRTPELYSVLALYLEAQENDEDTYIIEIPLRHIASVKSLHPTQESEGTEDN